LIFYDVAAKGKYRKGCIAVNRGTLFWCEERFEFRREWREERLSGFGGGQPFKPSLA
jgi:hypothetical protein